MFKFKSVSLLLSAAFLAAAALLACGGGGWSERADAECLHPEQCKTKTTVNDTDLKNCQCGECTNNQKGIGEPCTKDGGECESFEDNIFCDKDLSPLGTGTCILPYCQDDSECGDYAKCCKPDESPFPICLGNECLPSECGGSYDIDPYSDSATKAAN